MQCDTIQGCGTNQVNSACKVDRPMFDTDAGSTQWMEDFMKFSLCTDNWLL